MKANRTDQKRNVRVRYQPGEYGLALSIFDELDGTTADEDEGVLTVIQSGVTTLELRRREGSGPSMLIWDEAEVDWDLLQAS